MVNINTFSGVGAAGMSWTLHVSGFAAAAAHPAAAAAHPAAAAQAIIPSPKRRTEAATAASVKRGTT
jgi:hypothetical protein